MQWLWDIGHSVYAKYNTASKSRVAVQHFQGLLFAKYDSKLERDCTAHYVGFLVQFNRYKSGQSKCCNDAQLFQKVDS